LQVVSGIQQGYFDFHWQYLLITNSIAIAAAGAILGSLLKRFNHKTLFVVDEHGVLLHVNCAFILCFA